MATLEHATLTDPNLHDLKGVASASNGELPVATSGATVWKKATESSIDTTAGVAKSFLIADGAGGSSWQMLAMGGITNFNAAGVALTSGSNLTTTPWKVDVATTASSSMEFTGSATGRLTYTGTKTRHFHIAGDICTSHSAGADRDVIYEIYKNGVAVPNSRKIRTSSSGSIGSIALHYDFTMAQNDYIEVYVYTTSGNATAFLVHQFYFFAMGVPGV